MNVAVMAQMGFPVMTRTRMIITPQQAKAWLERNTNNRTQKRIVRNSYVSDMKRGAWLYNPSTAIIFDSNGELIDGQHRLVACVIANVPFESDVLLNAAPEIKRVIDIGAGRTVGDFAKYEGHQNSNRLAAVARLVVIERQRGASKISSVNPTKTEIQDEVISNHEKLAAAFVPNCKGLCANSVADFCNYGFREKDPVAAASFMNSVFSGEEIKKGDPAFILRQRLIDNHASRAKLEMIYVIAIFRKAWRHYRAGQSLHSLRWTESEEFPVVAA